MTNTENLTTNPAGMAEMGLATETAEHHLVAPDALANPDVVTSGLAALEAETEA